MRRRQILAERGASGTYVDNPRTLMEQEHALLKTLPALLFKDACPKCGRVLKRGMYMHQKYCKGK